MRSSSIKTYSSCKKFIDLSCPFFIIRDGDDESSDVDSDENNSVGKRKKLQKGGFTKKAKNSETPEEQALKVFFYFII